jgi:hypothetical protein
MPMPPPAAAEEGEGAEVRPVTLWSSCPTAAPALSAASDTASDAALAAIAAKLPREEDQAVARDLTAAADAAAESG